MNNKTEMPDKIWCNIEGYEGYLISNYGDVISYRKRNSKELAESFKTLKQHTITTHCGKKYNRVSLQGKNIYTHRLVARHFIENPQNKPQVNHIDNDPTNNVCVNLEWVTNSENQIHRFKINGTKNNLEGYIHKQRNGFRVYKKGCFDKSFRNLEDAKRFKLNYFNNEQVQ